MNQLPKPSLAMLALFSALAALPVHGLRSEPRLLAQGTATPTPTFTLQESVPAGTTLSIDGSPSMAGINQSLAEGFEQRYPDTDVEYDTGGDEQALQALRGGDIDLAALGRALSENEQDPSLTSIPVTREKIAIIVGRDNPFRGDLTFEDFAAIFRGEITNWAQVGGPNVPLRFVDRPAESSTRLALADYEIFSAQPFETGSTAVQVAEDDTAAVVRELGRDGISYAIASEILGQDAVRPVSMDSTLPDDPRYPYSQPRNYIYQGEPSLPVAAFLGFATSEAGQTAVAAAQETASANVTVGASRLPGGVALAPDGSYMVRGTEDGQLQWLDADGNATATTVADAHRGAVSDVVVSPDGQTVISSGADGTLRRWDRSGNPIGEPMAAQGGPILALAVSPDGQSVASGGADGTVERWSLADGTALGAPIAAHSGPVQALHYPVGGQTLITGGSDGSLAFWNADGSAAGQAANAHSGGVTTITSSPDGQVLTTTGGDGSLRNWDRSTLQPRGETIAAHDGAVSAVAYSPDGGTLATAGTDGTLQLWSPDGTAQLEEPVQLDEPAASLGYTPAGQLVVGTSDRAVELRDGDGRLMSDTEPEDDLDDPNAPATGLGNLWQRLQNLPPSAWWMLAVIPALLLLAGIVGSLFGRDRDEEDELEGDLEGDRSVEAPLGPGLGINFAGVGNNLPITAGPVPPETAGDEVGLPPEAGLVPSDEYPIEAPTKPEQARQDLAEGRRLMREGRYDAALIYFNQAIEATEVERLKADATGIPARGINAIAAQAQAERGAALALLGQASDAMDSFNAALQLDTSVIDAWIGKGRLLNTMARYEEAIFCFDTALELDPTSVSAHQGKGQALMEMGRQSEGQACLARAAALAQDNPMPPEMEGIAFAPQGIPESAAPGLGTLPGTLAPEYAPPADYGYDPDVPLELQQMVQRLPSADVEMVGAAAASSVDVPPALAAEAARLPDRAEDASTIGAASAPASTPASNAEAGAEVGESFSTSPVPLSTDTTVLEPPADTTVLEPPSTLEAELLSQVHLGTPSALGTEPEEPPLDTKADTNGGTATVSPLPPLRPAPVPVPPPVPLEPGDYIPPPAEASAADGVSGLEGLPPEVVAALASIPAGSPDSFGPLPTAPEPAADEPATAANSWIRLSIDQEGDRFYAVWQIDEGDRAQAKAEGGETMTLRLYDVTGKATNEPLPTAAAEQRCRDDFAQDWYLPIPQWDRIYVVEVGYVSGAGDWQAIAQSAEVAAISAA
ncbi:substrate-binding domain-containing protein [Nodosilinea sp. PGN35]|uniref:substrate-binding domain-containing protein n=1 Tax=Nodosilinea sp. PGN35 TaxID=3020489 RepID=UPI0023B2F37F|nr:substrate-binding domain-containing protein [Nodosilinea sp. TSF1-S3]MDF0368334.1 substrate-binding domain-containing protein [Nodosilinea sp. TSF1-S3]